MGEPSLLGPGLMYLPGDRDSERQGWGGASLPALGHIYTFPTLSDSVFSPENKFQLAEKSPVKENLHFEWTVAIPASERKSFCC